MKKLIVILAVLLLAVSFASADEFGQNNVVIVLDASGSMGGNISGTSINKMQAAEDAIWNACKDLPTNTKIGILVFSASNLQDDWVYPIGQIDKERLKQAIFTPKHGGGTPLGTYIKKGADAILAEREKQLNYGTFRLIIVTDGAADWGGESSSMKRYAEEIPSRGLRMDVIGVDMSNDHALKEYAHSYIAANDVKTLDQAMKKVLIESLSSSSSGEGLDDSLLEAYGGNINGVKVMMQGIADLTNQPLGEARPTKPQEGQPEASSGQVDQQQATEGEMGFAKTILVIIGIIVAICVIFTVIVKLHDSDW